MKGRLYTADEIFQALWKATEKATDDILEEYKLHIPEEVARHSIAVVGGNIAYCVAEVLGFDMEQLDRYCREKLEEEDSE